MNRLKKLSILAAIGTIALLLIGLFLLWIPLTPAGMNLDIPQGAGYKSISRQIASHSGAPAWLFELTARISGDGKRIKAGRFELAHSHTALTVWQALAQAAPEMAMVKLLEGWTFKQFRKAINDSELRHDSANWTDEQIMAHLGVPGLHPEGRFFPDTYALALGSSDLTLYKTAFDKMRKLSENLWDAKPADSPLKNIDELLNLAAIIEKETGLADERRLVASVFHNRLKIGMRLQTDPTVIYGMGERYKGQVRKVDLETDTPYNTYTRSGLPPSPIAAPSEASLIAALKPDASPYFYFVAKGDGSGGSFFSANLQDHNRAVAQYLANRRSQ